MNWNAKPENVTLPPQYPKKQSSFLEQALINTLNTTSQNSLNYPGSNQEACMFLGNSNPVSQPLLNIRNYTTPQQIPIPDMHNGTLVASQTSVERITYANVKGSKQLNHNLQMSSGVTQNVWLNSPMRNSMLSHTGATVSHQTGFGTNTPNIHALQNQFVTSDSYSMQLQMIPSNSARVPVTYQGAPRLNPSLSERQVDWAQQYTSSGLTYPDYRPLPKQYSYSSRSCLQEPTLQKQNPMPSTSLHIKNSHPPDSPRTLQSKQTAAIQSYQYAVTQTDKRPPPPPYDCRYTSQPLQSTQHVIKQSSVDIPQNQEMHLPEMRKDFSRSFQQHWQNLNENGSTVGNSCNLKVNTNVTQAFNEPVRSSVAGVQTLAQNNQERRIDSCDLTSNQVLDTSATKEKLVRDIKTLVEIKKKFSELARKIKINKNLLMAAGCIKTTDTSYSELAPNSELSLKQTAQIQSGPQVTLGTPEDKPPSMIESAKETHRTHSTMNSNIQDPNWGNRNQVNSVLLNSVYSEKLPMPDQLHDLQVRTSLKASTLEITQATLNNTQISSGNVNVELNVPTNSETPSVPQSTSFEEYVSKYPNKNTLILSLLTCRDKPQEKLLKNASETIQGSKPHSFEINPNTQISGNQPTLKTMETSSTCNINAKVLDNSFCLEHKSSTSGVSSKSDSHFSMELLATCLSLWKKQPSEPTEEKQYNESKNRTAVGVSMPVETCDKSPFSVVGHSQNKIVNTLQETALSTVVQNYESSSATVTKGTELQVAVVSPLILSDVKTLSAKGITPEAVPETLYPVIKEGSVCSLQNQLAENTSVTAPLKASLKEPVAGTTTNTKVFSPIQKEEQNESANSEDTPNSNQGRHIKSEPDTDYSVSEGQASCKSRNSDTVSGDMLHIDNICSLVEGDTSYNSQIAKIFNLPPLKRVEPQKSLPNHQVITKGQQKGQIDTLTESKDFGFQNGNFLQCTDVSHKITDQTESLQPPETSLKYVKADSGILEESSLDHITKKESMANDVCSSSIQQDSCPQEVDSSCSYTTQDPARSEILSDKASVLYLHDQLSELLKEFPYGIEAVNTHEGFVAQQINHIPKDQTCDKTGCDSKDLTDQIQITILNSDQMKELFPEHDSQVCEVDKLTEHQKEEPVKKEGSNQCDPQADTDGKTDDNLMDSEKDDVGCCALGWLSMVYEGVPQCQCNSINSSTLKEEKGEDQCSPSKINSHKLGERTSDRNVPVGCSSPLNNNTKIPLTFPDMKNHFPEIDQGKNTNGMPKTKHHKSLKTEQELPGQFLSKGDKKLDSMQSHKRKGKLQFHEITFHTSSKMTKFSQESLHQKLLAQNSRPLKAKVGFLTNKNKDLRMKNSSLVQSVSPEKIKLKAGGLRQKVSEKRKLDDGSILDSKIKRKKYDKREQNKNVGDGSFKLCNFSSITNERARVKEKAVSNIKSSGSKDSSSKINRVLTPKEYLQRQKHKEAVGSNASKKSYVRDVPCDSQYMKPSKLSMQVGSCGKSNERHNSSVQTSRESLNICSSHGKNLKIHHSEESKPYISRNVKGIVCGKQADKMWIDKSKLDKSLSSINSEVEFSQMPPQSKDQRKLYLNRVAFKCTEHESICLTKLDSSPRKLNKERRPEDKPQSLLPVKDATEKPNMLEFKLCPDGLIKNTNSVDWKDLQPCPRKEQASVQVSGIKSTKEDWLRGVTEEKRMPEANQEIGKIIIYLSFYFIYWALDYSWIIVNETIVKFDFYPYL
uniref:Retroelement silencing factor 1 n=1 Tax=Ursus americanus TaxID=9643 RepID=A0A452R9E4_URSAM